MSLRTISLFVFTASILALLQSCQPEPVPRPRGYFRIELSEKAPKQVKAPCGIKFDLPKYAGIERLQGAGKDTCWFNVYAPRYNARLHLSFIEVDNNLQNLVEDAYQFAFQHEQKANAITRTPIISNDGKSSGLLYDLTGNVASPVQFFVTDSTTHFIRGGLYFQNLPNEDSLAPVVKYLREDVIRIMETIRWKENN